MTITGTSGYNEKDCVGEAKSRISVLLWCVSLETSSSSRSPAAGSLVASLVMVEKE